MNSKYEKNKQIVTGYLRLILESKSIHVIFQKRQKNVKKGQYIWKFGQKCTRFEIILKKGRRFRATIACSKLLEKTLLPSGLFSIQQLLVAIL